VINYEDVYKNAVVLTDYSLDNLKQKIDEITNKRPVDLILPAGSSIVETYKGFRIRQWKYENRVRWDTAYY